MKVWVVMDGDSEVVAIYTTAALADAHLEAIGGWIHEDEVRDTLHPDATDPVRIRECAESRDRLFREHQARMRKTD